ncbi:amidohydrolase [Natronincola ferrireducens]|uniref:Aminobenzoyl-glutamate utilization protein A n=1 Tax=Natronincola ferrireducens TaxID=393762 RepID=A0A1G8ZIY5_9FIRM|nr:amidohydrolase [Natronincola ferrireducens]SDK14365.1 aminobenzoyl-glutamate utilization protein A [Natronincola ferrireducens]
MDYTLDKIIKYRREFHKYPETGWKEIRTSARIAEILSQLGYENIKVGTEAVDINTIVEPVRLSEDERKKEIKRAISQGGNKDWIRKANGYPGVVAEIDTGNIGPTVAFRFDIDALVDTEPYESGHKPFDEEYISINPNSVHACGHDGHIAIGLGLAKEILKHKKSLRGKIKLLFQPAEETFSGAESMVTKGHLDDVDYFFSMHIGLSYENKPLPSKSIACGCCDFLSDRQLDVYFQGKAAHPCGASQEGKNTLLAACTAALNIHSIAPHEEGLFRVNVGEIHAGVCANTIPANALIRVEYRGENSNITNYGKNRVLTIIEAAAKMYELTYKIVDYGEVPTAKSDKEMIDIVKKSAKKVSWFENIYDYGNVGGTDDATVMMKKVQDHGGKAVYIGLGADVTEPLHNPKFDFDENVLIAATNLFVNILKDISSCKNL